MFKRHTHPNHTGLLLAVLLGLLFFTECREKPKSGNQPPTAQPSVPVPVAQMETGPGIQLVPVDAKTVFSHYINHVVTQQENYIELYDGGTPIRIDLRNNEIVGVSNNKRFFTTARFLESDTLQYEVELRNLQNQVISRGIVSGIGSFESTDDFHPFDDGTRILIKGDMDDLPAFCIFSAKPNGERFTQDFFYSNDESNYKANRTGDFSIDEAHNKVIIAIQTHNQKDWDRDSVLFECYTLKGKLLWKTILPDILLNGFTKPSEDGTISFSGYEYKSIKESRNLTLQQFFMNENGKLLGKCPTQLKSPGNYGTNSFFQVYNGKNYLIVPSDANHIYLIDVDKRELVNKKTDHLEDYVITYAFLTEQGLVYTFFKTKDVNNEFVAAERGLILETFDGKLTEMSTNVGETLEMIIRDHGNYARVNPKTNPKPISIQEKIYKILIK
jgi:hypothetical protein